MSSHGLCIFLTEFENLADFNTLSKQQFPFIAQRTKVALPDKT